MRRYVPFLNSANTQVWFSKRCGSGCVGVDREAPSSQQQQQYIYIYGNKRLQGREIQQAFSLSGKASLYLCQEYDALLPLQGSSQRWLCLRDPPEVPVESGGSVAVKLRLAQQVLP